MPNLIGIAITPKILAPMEEIKSAEISIEAGIKGDARGKKRNRQISILLKMIGLTLVVSWELFSPGSREEQIYLYPT